MKLLTHELNEFAKIAKEENKKGNFAAGKKILKEQTMFLKSLGINQFGPVINLFTIPIYISFFLALRSFIFSPEKFQIIETGGFLWIPSGFLPDPYFILPIGTALVSYWTIVNTLKNNPMSSRMPLIFKKMKVFLPFFPVFSALAFATMPSGLNFYIFILTSVNYLSNQLFQSKLFKRQLGIPDAYENTKLHEELQAKHELELEKRNLVSSSNFAEPTPNQKITTKTENPKMFESKPLSTEKYKTVEQVKVFSSKPVKKQVREKNEQIQNTQKNNK